MLLNVNMLLFLKIFQLEINTMNIQETNPHIEELTLRVPTKLLKGIYAKRHGQKESILTALEAFKYIAGLLEITDYSNMDILDYGCGVKFSQAILQFDIPVKSYTGIDIDADMIAFLQDNVQRTNMEYYPVSFYNALYNTTGDKMTADYLLPFGDRLFDLVTMQSVMTHFNPNDFEVCLKMLKKYLKPNGKIFFTCILARRQEEDFKDLTDKPLQRASFREDYALELIEKAGFNVDIYKRRKTHKFFPEHIICSAKK